MFLQGTQILVECCWTVAPWFLRVVVLQRIQLFLHPFPALQAAPQPIRVDHLQVLTTLCLTDLLCAWMRGKNVEIKSVFLPYEQLRSIMDYVNNTSAIQKNLMDYPSLIAALFTLQFNILPSNQNARFCSVRSEKVILLDYNILTQRKSRSSLNRSYSVMRAQQSHTVPILAVSRRTQVLFSQHSQQYLFCATDNLIKSARYSRTHETDNAGSSLL